MLTFAVLDVAILMNATRRVVNTCIGAPAEVGSLPCSPTSTSACSDVRSAFFLTRACTLWEIVLQLEGSIYCDEYINIEPR